MKQANSKDKPRYSVQSVAKAMALLEAMAEAGRPLTLSELARAMGISKATTYRFCHTFTQLRFIYRDAQKRYNLTPKVLTLGFGVIRGQDWLKVAHYHLEQLSNETKETVNLAVLDDTDILYLKRIKPDATLPFDLHVGSKFPIHCSSMGKCLMAFMPQEKVQPILYSLEFKPFTEQTITRLEDFLKELSEVRKKGYSINDGEFSIAVRSVAAPIRNAQDYAIAAINIILPIKRYSRTEAERFFAPLVMKTADEISRALQGMELPLTPS